MRNRIKMHNVDFGLSLPGWSHVYYSCVFWMAQAPDMYACWYNFGACFDACCVVLAKDVRRFDVCDTSNATCLNSLFFVRYVFQTSLA